MDFHSLARKELQTLCKKNKIPANMTNVSMADALQALQHVEGLNELLNASASDLPQTPAKNVIGTSDIPHTACRTSTRRKPIKEPESSHPLTITRRGARKTVSKEPDQEKKCASVHETVSEKNVKNVPGQDKSGVPKTPAALSSQRKARPAASACKKMDAQKKETTVSTRRSMRFLEKNMAELSLKEKERIEPVMFEELSEEVEEKDAPGTDLQTVSEDDSVKTDDIQEDTSNEFEVNDCNAKLEVGSGKLDNLDDLVSDVKDEAHDVVLGENFENTDDFQEDTSNEFGADDFNAKLEVGYGKPDNLDVLLEDEAHDVLGENFEKSTDNEITDANGPADVPVTQLSPETDNLNGDGDMEQDDSSAVKISDDVSMVVDVQSSLSQETNSGSELNEVKDDYHGNSTSELKSPIEEGSDDENLSVFQENKKSDIEVGRKASEAAVLPEDQMICFEQSDIKELGTSEFESNATDTFPVDTDFENDPKDSMNVEDPAAEMEKYNTEALVNVHVMEAEDVAMTNFESSGPCQEKTPCQAEESMPKFEEFADSESMPKIEEFANSETLVDVYVMSEEGFSMTAHEGFPSSDKTQMGIRERRPYPFSSPLASQLPQPQLTPRKKQTTIQNSIHVLDENKENIDSSCCSIVKLKKEGKKEQVLDQMSLRRLTKLYKEKLIKRDPKNCEDKNATKQQEGKTRPALKTLPENCMAANEAVKDN